jgi:hypothetical protein
LREQGTHPIRRPLWTIASQCWEHYDADYGPQRNRERSRCEYTLRIGATGRANR